MRKLGYGIALGVALLTAGLAHTRPRTAFDLEVCASEATDIVVTDPEGRVLESWRGELKPGDVVRLGPARFTPTNALPWEWLRLRPDRVLSAWYQPREQVACRGRYTDENAPPAVVVWPAVPEVADTELRLVLFLRKEGGTVWMPAGVPSTPQRPVEYFRMGREPSVTRVFYDFDPNPDFTTSIAWVEAGRVLTFQHLYQTTKFSCDMLLTPVAIELKHFKTEVLAHPAPPGLKSDTPKSNVTASFSATLENPAARIWADTKK